MLDVLEHVQDRQEILKEAGRVLAPLGHLILTVPAHPGLWTRHDDSNHHLLRYSRGSLLKELSQAGFTPERTRFLFHGLVIPKVFVRLKESMGFVSHSTPRLPPGPFNNAAFAIMRAENALLSPLRLPFGTSLMVTARLR